jgi:hypothetical protein
MGPGFFLSAAALGILSTLSLAHARATPPLVLEATIPLDGVAGRIDHMAVDLKRRRLFVAELGNDTVDVVDLSVERVAHRLDGLKEPQGVGYSAKSDMLAVANAADGSVVLFRGEDLVPAGSFSLGNDADNVRVNPQDGMFVVGYGRGGLAVIDPERHSEVGRLQLPAHPESFQIDPGTGRVFVNLPDSLRLATVDLNAMRILDMRKFAALRANFPMALDPATDVVTVVFRLPPTLMVMDRESAAPRAQMATCSDADDMFFDDKRRRIYISCGSGELASIEWDGRSLRPLRSVTTFTGARTSLFVPALDRLFVAGPAARSGGQAAILVYRPEP